MKNITLLLILLLSNHLVFAAPDYQREKRLANEVVDSIIDGEAVWLSVNNHKFLSIYTEATLKKNQIAKGTLLILHGRGYHPNWQSFIQPARVELAESGWHTLSVQLPVLEKNSTYYEYVPLFDFATDRITAALDFLNKKHPSSKKIIIAHSCGFHMANHWIGRTRGHDIDGFVAIGAGPTDAGQNMRGPFFFRKLRNVPILDVYAEFDYPKALRLASLRRSLFTSNKSKQIVIKDANHYYTEKSPALIKQISKWLDTL